MGDRQPFVGRVGRVQHECATIDVVVHGAVAVEVALERPSSRGNRALLHVVVARVAFWHKHAEGHVVRTFKPGDEQDVHGTTCKSAEQLQRLGSRLGHFVGHLGVFGRAFRAVIPSGPNASRLSRHRDVIAHGVAFKVFGQQLGVDHTRGQKQHWEKKVFHE